MSNNIIDHLNWRYATKIFDKDKKISEEQLDVLLESLRLSPSSHGLQPWKFLVVKNAEIREKIKEASYSQVQTTDASDLIVLCAKTNFGEQEINNYIDRVVKVRNVSAESLIKHQQGMVTSFGKRSEEEKQTWARNQVYIALGFLLETCAMMEIDSCPMEGFDKSKVDEILGLKEKGLMSVVMCPVGYRSVEDKYATASKVRFSVQETVLVIE